MPAREYVDNRVVADSRQYAVDRVVAVDRVAVQTADPLADYLFYDTFTDDDDTELPNHTPDKDTEGGGWTEYDGDLDIKSNTVKSLTDASNNVDVADMGEADVIIEAEFKRDHVNTADNKQWGFCFRLTDAGDYYAIRYLLAGVSSLRFGKMDGSAWSELGPDWVAVAWNNGDTKTMRLEISGDDFEIFVDDVSKISITDTSHQGQEEHGIFFFGVSESSIDDFRVKAN